MGLTPVTARRPVVAFVVTGGLASAMAERARSFASRLSGDFGPRLVCAEGGRASAAGRMLRDLFAVRPDVCYVLDIAATPVVAGGAYQAATGTPLVIDFGDAVVELGQVRGRGRFGMLATQALELFALRAADRLVVRGTFHKELLADRGVRAEFIPDGVAVDQFAPPAGGVPLPDGAASDNRLDWQLQLEPRPADLLRVGTRRAGPDHAGSAADPPSPGHHHR